MSTQKETVQRYIDGFRCGDLTRILSCLADDVVGHGSVEVSAA
jgi:hypothetical protein